MTVRRAELYADLGKVVWANGKLDVVEGSGRYVDRPPFPISYDAVAKMNHAMTPRAVVKMNQEDSLQTHLKGVPRTVVRSAA